MGESMAGYTPLLRWVDDGPEPCDRCMKPVMRYDDYVAFRNPFARDGVRFLCLDCYDLTTQPQAAREAGVGARSPVSPPPTDPEVGQPEVDR